MQPTKKPRPPAAAIIDPPSRPKKKGRQVRRRRFGIERWREAFQANVLGKSVLRWPVGWMLHQWYDTEKQRDQALATLLKTRSEWDLKRKVDYRKVDRE